MPRTYKKKPGSSSRPYTVTSTETLERAYESVRGGKSQRVVCKDFNLTRSVLQRYLDKRDVGERRLPPGGQTIISHEMEQKIVNHLVHVSEWGFPFDMLDLRMAVKRILDIEGRHIPLFKENCPGREWAMSFLQRHKTNIGQRLCQNIAKKRAAVSKEVVTEYFKELEKTLEGVPPENMINYDETNLTDDPGRKKMIFKRGVRYPERIMNSSKSSTSLMFAGTASGVLLPVYVVYKAENLWSTWTEKGPAKCRYNRSKSGWFDHICFDDWFRSIVLPYCCRLEGKKVMIGDNLSSHFSHDILKECENNNIAFVCLPANATHLLQPLDVAFFGPMKTKWRAVLTRYKLKKAKNAGTVAKDQFPKLLKELMDELPNQSDNLKSGFEKCGIHPCKAEPVLKRLPKEVNDEGVCTESVSNAFMDQLQHLRSGDKEPAKRNRRKRLNVVPGRSLGVEDLNGGEQASAAAAPDDQPGCSSRAEQASLPAAPEVDDQPGCSDSDSDSEADCDTSDLCVSSEDEWLPKRKLKERNIFADF